MTRFSLMTSVMLLVVTALGAWLDFRRVEVPNWLSVAGVILGVGLNQYLFGVRGLMVAAAGVTLAVGTYGLLHLLRNAGLGRLKLMAPVGAIVGPTNWLLICVFAVLLGIPIAVYAASTVRLQRIGATKGLILREFLQFLPPYHGNDELRLSLHHDIAAPQGSLIAVGALFLLAVTAVWASR